MRKLASVQRIADIQSIPGADAIEVATINGWKVVVRKNEFFLGDRVVYFEIDSWIPHELAPFLGRGKAPKEYEGVEGYRLRTVKLRGQLSQGMALPLGEVLSSYVSRWSVEDDFDDGEDMTCILNIKKWEPQISACLAGQARGLFPEQVPKTDEERIQNLVDRLPKWQDNEFDVTEKLDGSSCTFYLDGVGDFHVCSRNIDIAETEGNTFWQIARKKNVESKMRELGLLNVAIQGELIGPGIQGNKYKFNKAEFYMFRIYDVDIKEFKPTKKARMIAEDIDLLSVPSLGLRNISTLDDMLKMADGDSVLSPVAREGLVWRMVDDPSVSFKVISNRFLLKESK
jgi:RNA ligase (TIGR02306 family)